MTANRNRNEQRAARRLQATLDVSYVHALRVHREAYALTRDADVTLDEAYRRVLANRPDLVARLAGVDPASRDDDNV